jgi:hypothetical protein
VLSLFENVISFNKQLFCLLIITVYILINMKGPEILGCSRLYDLLAMELTINPNIFSITKRECSIQSQALEKSNLVYLYIWGVEGHNFPMGR